MTDTALSTQPTPPQEALPPNSYASYVPHDLQYGEAFEDSLISAVLDSNTDPDNRAPAGIRVIPEDSVETPVDGVSIRAGDVSLQSLPVIREDELPLALDDKRRIFASSIPGIRLTHPGGYLEGGPGLDPDMDTFPDDFLSTHPGIRTSEELRVAVAHEVEKHVAVLHERLRARRRAKEQNEDVERKLKALLDQHHMEMKSLQRMAEQSEKKRLAREKRRKDRETG